MEKIIDQVYGVHIPHNRIHRYLLEEGLAGEEPKKKRKGRRKPYVSYEREHSTPCHVCRPHRLVWLRQHTAFTILDDASRKVLVAGEFLHADTDNSINVVDRMVEGYWSILPMRELIMDNAIRGAQEEW